MQHKTKSKRQAQIWSLDGPATCAKCSMCIVCLVHFQTEMWMWYDCIQIRFWWTIIKASHIHTSHMHFPVHTVAHSHVWRTKEPENIPKLALSKCNYPLFVNEEYSNGQSHRVSLLFVSACVWANECAHEYVPHIHTDTHTIYRNIRHSYSYSKKWPRCTPLSRHCITGAGLTSEKMWCSEATIVFRRLTIAT